MSNSSVGPVYAQIINDVVEAAGVDFEEGGVDASALADLKAGWQHKLSQMKVAQFPWDPKPQPTPAENPTPAPPAPPTSMGGNAAYTQATLSPPSNSAPLSHPGPIPNGLPSAASSAMKPEPNEPAVKQEPGLSQQPLQAYHAGPAAGVPRATHTTASDLAQQRAAQNLASKYGSRADAAITSLYNAKPGQQPGPAQPGQQPQQPMNPAQYSANLAAQMQQRAQQTQQQSQQSPYSNGANGLPHSQVDGPSEGFEAILMQRNADGKPVEMGRVEIDDLIHAQIASRAKQMEGGGLMLPLREAVKHRSIATKRRGGDQVDGADDIKDEDVDADAINSDLDDPDEDDNDDEDDDEAQSHMMLCMYDKVQRVKNKWKCTLKDGVLTVMGKEYVFHKATGEYEW